jgi:aldehyde dehydrogenase (NAD+)
MTDFWHEKRLLIDGKLRPAAAGAEYDNVNPATEEVIGRAADASPEDIEAAIVAARNAFDESRWSTDVEFRASCLRQLHATLLEHREELTEITIAEVGAPRSACAGTQVVIPSEFPAYYADVIEGFEWTSDLGKRDTMGGPCLRWVEREPIGVVAAITPWNVPTQINLAKLVPALAAGCTAILKPAPDTPWTGLALGHFISEHTDIPAGVVNVVTSADRAIGEHLTTDPRVDMISFTGSTAVGKRVMEAASANLTKVFLELGGKSVSLVLDDVADFGMVAATAAFGTAMVCGQGCALTTRILLPRSRYEEGVAAIANMMGIIKIGDPGAEGTQMGPLINRAQLERVEAYVQSGIDQGARVVCGARRPESAERGFFYEMTLLADVTNEMKVAREEIFGPVLVAIPYDDDDHAIRIANDSVYGLSGAIFSADETRAHALARRIRTGTMSINGGVWYAPDVPFGGYKQSGIGREMGIAGLEEHLELKAYARPAPR